MRLRSFGIFFIILFVLSLVVLSSPSSALAISFPRMNVLAGKVYYVSPSGNDANDGSQAHPFATINKAASLTAPGTTVHVEPGNYTQNVVSTVSGRATARITFVSVTKWGAKIQSVGVQYPWLNQGDYVDIIGFDITSDQVGRIGILNYGSYDSIKNNHVHNIPASACTSDGGAGIDNANYSASDDDVIGNVVHDNGPAGCTQVQGIYHSTLRGHIQNNITYRNSGFGIHLWHAANNVVIANNLSFNNGQAGIIVGAGDSPGGVTDDYTIVSNNIVTDNQNWGIREIGQTGTHNQYLNNLVYHNANGGFLLQNGNTDVNTLSVDPKFVNYQLDGSGDYHLIGSSPAIDSGTSIGAPSYDLDGNKRPQGGAFDRGVYEYIDKIAPIVSITNPANDSNVKRGSQVMITVNASDDVSVTKVEFSINGTLLCTVMTSPYLCSWTVPGRVGGTYVIIARAYDASGNTGLSTIKVNVVP